MIQLMILNSKVS